MQQHYLLWGHQEGHLFKWNVSRKNNFLEHLPSRSESQIAQSKAQEAILWRVLFIPSLLQSFIHKRDPTGIYGPWSWVRCRAWLCYKAVMSHKGKFCVKRRGTFERKQMWSQKSLIQVQVFPITRYVLSQSLSRGRLFETPWTVALQAPPSLEFSRQAYWSRLPFPSPIAKWANHLTSLSFKAFKMKVRMLAFLTS